MSLITTGGVCSHGRRVGQSPQSNRKGSLGQARLSGGGCAEGHTRNREFAETGTSLPGARRLRRISALEAGFHVSRLALLSQSSGCRAHYPLLSMLAFSVCSGTLPSGNERMPLHPFESGWRIGPQHEPSVHGHRSRSGIEDLARDGNPAPGSTRKPGVGQPRPLTLAADFIASGGS